MSRFQKRVLARLGMPYPLGTCRVAGETCLVASTEDHGPILLARPPYSEAHEIAPGPGGCMSLVPWNGELYAIMGCFVGYKFQGAGIYRMSPEPSGAGRAPVGADSGRAGSAQPWHVQRILDVPFAHRIDFVERAGTRFLIAASIAADKSDPADWSRPGAVYASRVPAGSADAWELHPVLEGIHRNHGMLVTPFLGVPSVLISGTEGLFAASLRGRGADWGFEKVLDAEVSEIAVCDVDADGKDELLTIEPFHGSSLRVYRRSGSRWERAWEGAIEFGHCLLATMLNGVPSVLVSSRSGGRDLLLFQWRRGGAGRTGSLGDPERIVVDTGVGAANMLVLRHERKDLLFATNQGEGEIACYEVDQGQG